MKANAYRIYPAEFIKTDSGYVVRLRGFPGALTEGGTYDEAMRMARLLVLDVAETHFFDKETMPEAGAVQDGDTAVEIPADAALKIAVRNAMIEENCRPAALAQKMNVSPQSLSQYLRLGKSTGFNVISSICDALGRPMKVEV